MNRFSNQCPDSLEHASLACSAAQDLYHEMTIWFNNEENSEFNMN